MLRKLLALFLIGFISITYAQDRPGEIRGKVSDKGSGETLPTASVVVEKDGQFVAGGTTDMDGMYVIKPLQPGTYTVKASFMGYATQPVDKVLISPNKITTLNFTLTEESQVLGEVEVIEYTVPLIDPDKQGKTTTQEEIQNIPQRDVASIASTTAGVVQNDDGGAINVRGSRSDATDIYIDGIKVRGSSSIPQAGIDQLTVITGGLPAQYGDATGGIISITTRGPSNVYYGGIEYSTSELFDQYGWNLLGLNLSGPLVRNKEGDAIFGFFLAGEAHLQADPNPSAVGIYKVNDDKLAFLQQNPLRPAPLGTGTIKEADYLTFSDMENIKRRQNVQRADYRISGKFDLKTGKTTNLTFGGSLNYARFNQFQYEYALLNPENNPLVTQNSWRVFGRFQQRFLDSDESTSNIKNAYYSIQVDYSKFNQVQSDESHGEDLFSYGHVGSFDTQRSKTYGYGQDSATGLIGYLQSGFRDDEVIFTPGTANPQTTAYTTQYYDFAGEDPTGRYENIFQIQQGGGLLNGQRPANVYSLWFNTGREFNGYNVTDQSQFRVIGSGSADIKNHSIIIGFEYEQRVDRLYSVAPIGLWGLARQRANSHITQLDFQNPNPVYANGIFQDTVNYDRLYVASQQSYFDKSLRKKLNLAEDNADFINIDAYDPSFFDISMFSPDELLNEGNPVVLYYGYDAYGNKSKKNPSLDDFFNGRDANGNFSRDIGAFQPIYIAGYIQDKFAFRDLVFNVGVRVDRFDANQKVLKDPYSMFPTVSALEATTDGPYKLVNDLPANIGDDYVVYVNDLNDPTSVVGYRNGDTWFDQFGNEVGNPQVLAEATTTGRIAPFLRDPSKTSTRTDLTSESFTDYTPQINIMPRIAFNFPISDEAMFFAHYDILTQRPSAALRMNPVDYMFLEASQGAVLNNPNLRPERTIDYEVGFKQTLSKRSAITISAFYRELRDMIQVIPVNYAFPVNYLTFGNIDFGTVKGFSISYDLRRTGNVSVNLAYTLQFADGSGSSATSGLNLINVGQPNLRILQPLNFDQRHTLVTVIDYRYGKGNNYNGPVWWGKKVFESAGANFSFRAASGRPYTRQANALQAVAIGINQRPILKGSINGSRLPWQFRIDMRLNKQIDLKLGGKEEGSKGKMTTLNFFLDVQNLLDTRNITNIYRYTGNADDDGWLSSAEAQEIIANQTDSQSYIDLYSAKVDNPNNYSLPRRMRLGVQFNF